MNQVRKLRVYGISIIVTGVFIAVGLSLYALRQNINLYYTPSQVKQGQVSRAEVFRMGGLVVKGSIHQQADSMTTEFVLTDTATTIPVKYQGILPDLFREGQGIVAQGRMQGNVFVADQVLAKHDATYMPPAVKDAIEAAKKMKLKTSYSHDS